MIPTVLVPALLVGRWWVIAVSAVAWPILLGADGFGGDGAPAGWNTIAVGSLLAAVNAAAGVALRRGLALARRQLSQRPSGPAIRR